MSIFLCIVLFIIGLALVIYSAEKLVKAAVGTSVGFGISTFLISVVFMSFDPENLAVGAVGTLENSHGIASGSIIGAAMVAIAFAFGTAAVIAPMRFSRVPIRILVIPILAIALFWLLSLDLMISRKDGVVLFCAFAASVIFLVKASGNGIDIKRSGGIKKDIEGAPNRWKSAKLLIFSLIVIVVGSEMLVKSSETIMENFGISDTVFGMTVLALMLSIEELARELPAAMRGRPEISFGNVIGSIISFFLFNAAIIAFIRPFELTKDVLSFYLPMTFITTTLLCAFMITRKISRLHGVILIILYAVFIIRSYS